MKNDYNIKVITNKDLGNPDFIKGLLEAWFHEIDSKLTPEFFGFGEPVRHSFAEKGIDVACRMWVEEGMGLMLRRRGNFGYLATIDWWKRDQTLDTRPFPWSCDVFLRRKAGDDLAVKYFHFLIRWFDPAFGLLSINEQIDQKHFITFEDSVGTTEMYEGLDILEKEERLPGIYWITYFGPWSVKKIGKTHFQNLEAERTEQIDGGHLVTAYDSSTKIGSPKAHQIENKIADKLGKEYFFDKSSVDVESLKATPEEAEEIEKMTKEVKSKKKS